MIKSDCLNEMELKFSRNINFFSEKGFSLIELLIVMVILGLIAGLVGPQMFGKLGTARKGTAKAQIEMLMTTLDAYRLDVGDYPDNNQGLDALFTDPGIEKWDGPYLKKEVPLDPWDKPYNYSNPGEHGEIDIYSYGKDNQPGGEGEDEDIVSWQ